MERIKGIKEIKVVVYLICLNGTPFCAYTEKRKAKDHMRQLRDLPLAHLYTMIKLPVTQ